MEKPSIKMRQKVQQMKKLCDICRKRYGKKYEYPPKLEQGSCELCGKTGEIFVDAE